MPDLLSQLAPEERARLLEDLNYLNLQEIRSFCTPRGIPYRIVAEQQDGKLTATKDIDRKPVVLERVRHFLTTGDTGEATRISASIIRKDAPPSAPNAGDRLYYRWYAREHREVLSKLRELTNGVFSDGAVARVLAMEFWTRGEAPTLGQFADAWVKAKAEEHKLLTPEYAYLTDLQQNRAGSDWKQVRNARAQSALQTLERICPKPV
jgi:hypothetical protein